MIWWCLVSEHYHNLCWHSLSTFETSFFKILSCHSASSLKGKWRNNLGQLLSRKHWVKDDNNIFSNKTLWTLPQEVLRLLKTAIKSHDKRRPHTSRIPNGRGLISSTAFFVGRIRRLKFHRFYPSKRGEERGNVSCFKLFKAYKWEFLLIFH